MHQVEDDGACAVLPPAFRSRATASTPRPHSFALPTTLFRILHRADTIFRPFFSIYIYTRFFSSFQKFSKNCNNDYRTSLIGIVSFNTLVLTRNDLPPSSSPPFSFSGRVGEDDRCRMERRERCNIGGVASFFVHDSTTIISRTYFTQLLSFLFILLLLLLLLHHPAFSLGFDRRGTRSERANGQEVR